MSSDSGERRKKRECIPCRYDQFFAVIGSRAGIQDQTAAISGSPAIEVLLPSAVKWVAFLQTEETFVEAWYISETLYGWVGKSLHMLILLACLFAYLLILPCLYDFILKWQARLYTQFETFAYLLSCVRTVWRDGGRWRAGRWVFNRFVSTHTRVWVHFKAILMKAAVLKHCSESSESELTT